MFQIAALNLEHQNQLTKIQADTEAQIQKQAKINEQKAQDDHTIKMLQQRIKHLKQEQVQIQGLSLVLTHWMVSIALPISH